jgi:restriction system protein
MTDKVPQYQSFFNPILKALKTLGGSGTIKEINDKVIGSLKLTNDALERLHNPETGNETEIEYRLA